MKTKYLSILLVVGTLIVGIVLGAVGNGALQNKRTKELTKIRRPGGFTEFVMRNAKPTDEAQRADIEEILRTYGERYRELGGTHQLEMRALGDSLIQDLGSVLSDDQLNAVEDAMTSRRRRFDDDDGDRRKRRSPRKDEAPGSDG
ncbi:MAG: hypothetical protein HKN43_14460 [Rhodothermales bacterium]|nr:hypothetical protein [Rhodothermales bacterium]